MFAAAILTLFVAAPALASVTPLAPAPNDTFKEGSSCHIAWQADTTGKWKTMAIELMAGNNIEMEHITTVVTLDGTDATKTTYDYPCPSVTPNSVIYFYQFSTSADPTDLHWTGRFGISDANGNLTPPANSTEPDGTDVPWGNGALVDPSQATPPPAWLAGTESSSTPANGTTTNSTSSSTSATPTSSGFASVVASPSGSPSGNALNTQPSGSPSSDNSTSSNSTSSTNSGSAGVHASAVSSTVLTVVLGAFIACLL